MGVPSSPPAVPATGRVSPAAGRAAAAIYHLFLRGQLTRLRAVGLFVLSAISILLAFLARADEPNPVRTATEIMADYGMSIVVPVCTLWIATSLLGDLIEDRLLVYLWLKPVARWVLPVAALAATATIMVPLVVAPLMVAAAISGDGPLLQATLVATVVGVFTYGALFVLFGMRFSRALWWGLAYVLIWENTIARLTDGLARLSVRSYLASITSRITDVDLTLADRGTVAIAVVPVAVIVCSLALATAFMKRRDVD